MAKNNKNKIEAEPITKRDKSKEVVAKCDQPEEVITNSCLGKRPIGPSGDNQQFAVTNCDLKNINIESLIRTIRGQKVMVDFDLAMLYRVLNKRLNEQVKRNIKRFPDDFMFQLTKEEWNALRSQFATAKKLSNRNSRI